MQWRIWWILAFNDVRQRYRRSTLGQFWLTISMAVTIAGIGIVFGFIFDQRLDNYIPFLGVGLIIWALISGLTNELSTCFIDADAYIRAYPGPRSLVVYRKIARNLIITKPPSICSTWDTNRNFNRNFQILLNFGAKTYSGIRHDRWPCGGVQRCTAFTTNIPELFPWPASYSTAP